jgi:hypothetical protein
MTQDEIIEMAIENTINGLTFNQDGLVRFAKMIAEKERKACANLLETTDLGGLKDNPAMQSWVAEMLLVYVNAIKTRGENK